MSRHRYFHISPFLNFTFLTRFLYAFSRPFDKDSESIQCVRLCYDTPYNFAKKQMNGKTVEENPQKKDPIRIYGLNHGRHAGLNVVSFPLQPDVVSAVPYKQPVYLLSYGSGHWNRSYLQMHKKNMF